MSQGQTTVGMSDLDGGLDPATAAERCRAVVERVESAAVVDREVLAALLSAVVAKGHVLLEDVPGTGKTVTARVLAEALGLSFTRIQFTPDLLPSDVTGSNVYNEHEQTFEFQRGPVFTNVVLADEINRAPPKTQAALLEAMEERQVSVDGTTHPLPEPFVVIATQNPIEQEGTFRLPEAQRDRFSVKASLGYPDVEGELGLLERRANRRTLAPSVDPAIDRETVLALQELAEEVTVEASVRRYIVDLARQTRTDSRVEVGISPRGVQRVFEIARAAAVIDGRDYVVPDDVKRLAPATMAHRLVLTTEATVEGVDPADVVASAVDAVEVPGVAPNTGTGTDQFESDGDADATPAASTDGSGPVDPARGGESTDAEDGSNRPTEGGDRPSAASERTDE